MLATAIQILGQYDDLWLTLKETFQTWSTKVKSRKVYIDKVGQEGLCSLSDLDNHPGRDFAFILDGNTIYANQASSIIQEIFLLKEIPFEVNPAPKIPKHLKKVIWDIRAGKIKLDNY